MTDQEFKELFELLEKKGWEPKLCDAEIPYYDTPVACGLPTPIGDIITETKRMPHDYLNALEEFMVRVKGDSMKDANIFDGDLVKVNTKAHIYDGDIIVIWDEDDFTLKSFCVDEDGTPWLVPQNPDFQPFPVKSSHDVRIVGKVLEILHPNPHVSYRACMNLIKNAKRGLPQQVEVSQLQVSRTIREIAPMIKVARQWYAVYRAMADANVVKEDDFESFVEMVKTEVPTHKKLPEKGEMQRLAIQSFAKPIVLWNSGNAPVQGKRYRDYLAIARRAAELLGT